MGRGILIHTKREARDINFTPLVIHSTILIHTLVTPPETPLSQDKAILIHTKREARDILFAVKNIGQLILIHTKREARDQMRIPPLMYTLSF